MDEGVVDEVDVVVVVEGEWLVVVDEVPLGAPVVDEGAEGEPPSSSSSVDCHNQWIKRT